MRAKSRIPKTKRVENYEKNTKANERRRMREIAKKLAQEVDLVFEKREEELSKIATKLFEKGKAEGTVFIELKRRAILIVDFLWAEKHFLVSDAAKDAFVKLLMRKMVPIIKRLKKRVTVKEKRKTNSNAPASKYEKHARNDFGYKKRVRTID